ncbi:DUF4388 domain-containing protein [candidate division WOR-3 bacterium]|nr:DUF4388 domain-containing protein [candidate division WOR-3 bacterium]
MDLSANLEVFSPLEIINLISSSKKTGALYLDIAGENSEIYFEDGVPVHAEFKGLIGIEAIYNVAIEKKGSLQYKDKITIKEHTIKKNETVELIHNIEKRKIEFDDLLTKLPPFTAILEKRADGVQDNVALRKSDWTMIRLIDGKRDINKLIHDSNLPVLVVCQTLEWLIEKGLLFDKSKSERLRKDFEKMLNNIMDVYSVKGTNTNEWFSFIIETLNLEGFETISGMIKLNNEKIDSDESITKILTEEYFSKSKDMLYRKSNERANEELGKMLAKKKHKELLSREEE